MADKAGAINANWSLDFPTTHQGCSNFVRRTFSYHNTRWEEIECPVRVVYVVRCWLATNIQIGSNNLPAQSGDVSHRSLVFWFRKHIDDVVTAIYQTGPVNTIAYGVLRVFIDRLNAPISPTGSYRRHWQEFRIDLSR